MTERLRGSDDDIFRAHSRYLGPPGITLPFSVPYRAILPGAGAALAALVILSLLGVGGWRFIIALALGAATGALADRFSGTDRPVSALPTILGGEASAPRPRTTAPARAVLSPAAVPVRAPVRPEQGGQP
jgi:hypothetical protein